MVWAEAAVEHAIATRTLRHMEPIQDAGALPVAGAPARRPTPRTCRRRPASWLRLSPADLPVSRIVLKLASAVPRVGIWSGGPGRAVKPVWVSLRRDSDEVLALHREDDPHQDQSGDP